MKNSKIATTLFQSAKSLIENAKALLVRNVNTIMVFTYFEMGRMIVEEEQKGNRKADYAQKTLEKLSADLTREFGKGYSVDNLERFRKFYHLYHARISASVMRKSKAPQKMTLEKQPSLAEKVLRFSEQFKLSWTHYIQLLKIENEQERSFYEIEAVQNNWSVRELQRQYHSSLYERLALSKNKKGTIELAKKGQIIEDPTDALKEPYVLEFLNLKEDNRYTENELETAIINRLEHFMLELGKGFLYEGRQKRFTFEGDSFYVDLVFYNRLLRCFVLFDLKIGKLTHQDIGQMQMYVNYYDREVKLPDEKPTIGIILCKEENKTVVEFTLPEGNKQIFAKEYKLYLPSKADLKKQLE